MPLFRRKYGEKSTLLSKCGETLFGCSGKLLVTQGIYVPKSLSPSSTHCLCKRTVWVPDSLSHECLLHNLESFDATLPFPVQWAASLHRFGLCGINPTRTAYATDKQFLLLAKVPHRQFGVYGIIEIREAYTKGIIIIVSISTSKEDVLNCVDWIKTEFTLFLLSRKPKKRTSHGSNGGEEAQVIRGEKTTLLQGSEQDPLQHRSSETESDESINTPECLNPLCESVNPSNVSFSGLQSPNPLLWVPCFDSQSSREASGESNLSLFPSSLKSTM